MAAVLDAEGLELPYSTTGDFDEPDHMADAAGVTWGGYLVAYDANGLTPPAYSRPRMRKPWCWLKSS